MSLDPAANRSTRPTLDALVADLGRLCRVEVIGPCAAVSLVGRNIRAILHRLGEALELFEEQKIYLVTQAANDLNLTFVIDEDQGDRLVARLHEIAIRTMTADRVLGPTWEELYGGADKVAVAARQWWQDRRNELLALGREHGAAFVYDRETLKTQRASRCKAIAGHRRRLLRDEGQLASADPAGVRRARPRLRMRVARRDRARRRDAARTSTASASCSRRTSRRARSTSGRCEQGVWVTLDNLHPLQDVAGAVQGPRAVRAHRSRPRPRPSRQGAHGGRAFEVRRAAVRDRRAGASRQGCGREDRRAARAHRQRRVQRRQLAIGRRHARRR